jgi:hypothetical protein
MPRHAKRVSAGLLAVTALLLSAVPGRAWPAAAPTPTLAVNVAKVLRPVTHVAAGGLYALGSDTTPADAMVAPLHPRVFTQMAPGGRQLPNGATTPGGDALVVAAKAARVGAKVTIRMPDFYPEFPYGWISWSDWLHAVNSQVTALRKASDVKNIEAWELWNEPDWTWIPGAAGSFDAGWARTYKAVRARDAKTPILGPSVSRYDPDFLRQFLLDARASHTLPDIICWHELQGEDSIADDVKAYRALETSLGIAPRPIAIDEYGKPNEMGVPGALVGYIATFERAGVDSAGLAFWHDYGTFDDLVVDNSKPNGGWWLYKWYGAMSGNMVSTTPPAQVGLDGAASVNVSHTLVSVIFGGGDGANKVTVSGLKALPRLAAHVMVKLEYVPSPGRTVAVSRPITISTSRYTVKNGSITIPVTGMNSSNGYHLLISPV